MKEYGVKLNLIADKFKSKLQELKNNLQEAKDEFQTGIGIRVNTEELKKLSEESKYAKQSLDLLQKSPFTKLGYAFSQAGQLAKTFGKNLRTMVIDQLKKIPGAVGSGFKKILSGLGNIGSKALQAGKKLLGFKKTTNGIGKSMNKGVASLKRFAMGLIGVQSAYIFISRAMSTYMSYDNELQQSLQNTFAGFGSFLAPVLEKVIAIFQKLLGYANAVMKAFTGINFVARANAKAMNSSAKASGSASKALAGFDELTNINQDTGGGDGAGQIEVPEVDTSGIDNFINKIKEKFAEGDYFGVGEIIGGKLSEALASIPWGPIQEKAGAIGKGIAETLNGFIAGTDWTVIGNTIAQGLNTGINFAYNFLSTFDFRKFGESIGTSFETAWHNIDWAKLAQTLSDGFIGIFNSISGFLENVDWGMVAQDIETFFKNIKWGEIASSIFEELGASLGATVQVLWTWIDDACKSIGQYFKDKIKESGGNIVEGICKGIDDGLVAIGQWIYDHICKPFVDGFKQAFGIHSPSTVMIELTSYIVDGFKESLSNIVDRAKEIFTNLKEKIISLVTNIKDGVTSRFNSLKNSVVNTFNNIKNSVVNAWNGLWNSLKGIINKIIGGIETMVNTCIRGINKLLKPLTNVGNSILKAVGIKSFSFNAIGNVSLPRLKIGTDMVKEEGMAYLHAGEQVVPADVVKGGYTGTSNEKIEDLLQMIYDLVDRKEFSATIGEDIVGRASVDYIRKQRRITGGSVI